MTHPSMQPLPSPTPKSSVSRVGRPSQAQADPGVQFLLADFTNLREFNHAAQSGSDKRNDVLLALASALAIGVGLLHQTPIDSTNFLLLALLSAIALLVISWATYREILRKDIGAYDYIRCMNRIRAYFAEQAPEIQAYLLLPTSHDYPSYRSLWAAGHVQIPIAIMSLLTGAGAAIVTILPRNTLSLDLFSTGCGVGAFVLAYLLLRGFSKRAYQRAEEQARSARGSALFGSHESMGFWLAFGNTIPEQQ